jgi:hypothetical protein
MLNVEGQRYYIGLILSCKPYICSRVNSVKKVIVLILLFLGVKAEAQFELSSDLVELNGVVMTADSLRFIANAGIEIVNKNRGSIASDLGVFSLIAEKGDTLLFTSTGFKSKEYIIPKTLQGTRFSIIQLMVQDTFYLPETIIRPGPSKQRFDYAFKYWDIPDDKYELARKNTEQNYLRIVSNNLARDGSENQGNYQRILAERNTWTGQLPPQRIFSPLAWLDFFDAWKRGDYKRKKKK